MKQNVVSPAEFRQILDGINETSFVIGPHNSNKSRFPGIKSFRQDVPGYQTVGIRCQADYINPLIFQPVQGMGDTWMLHHRRYDTGFVSVQNQIRPDTFENRVIPFGGATVDDDVVSVGGANPRIDTVYGDTHLGMGFSTELMQ